MIEPNVSFSCEIKPEKAVLHESLINDSCDNFVKYSFNSVPSPDAKRYKPPNVQGDLGIRSDGAVFFKFSYESNKYSENAKNAFRAYATQNLSLLSPSGYNIAAIDIKSETR